VCTGSISERCTGRSQGTVLCWSSLWVGEAWLSLEQGDTSRAAGPDKVGMGWLVALVRQAVALYFSKFPLGSELAPAGTLGSHAPEPVRPSARWKLRPSQGPFRKACGGFAPEPCVQESLYRSKGWWQGGPKLHSTELLPKCSYLLGLLW